ncbi:hypothetical protein NQ318_003746 [Aromia moschata]|uniref:Cytochrome P450 n=1 Tax=Aromia moschata TaxID=1265417 RepID=A0AAV8YK61_9CUCU|nr:hypothetical protein NQ318_003746 [Aromia moschata]
MDFAMLARKQMFVTSLWFVDLILLLVTVAFLLFKYQTRKFDHWKRKGVFHLKPIPFFGNAYDLCTYKQNMGPWFKTIYNSVNKPFFGIFIFDKPLLVVKSPDLIKQILVRDFNTFSGRMILSPKHDQLFLNMMFIHKGTDWKKMSPIFTSGKLKGMFEIINNAGLDMNKYIKKNLGQLESKEICSKYSTDVIAACAFAIRAHSFENENADFRKIGESDTLYFLGHPAVNILRLNFFDSWTTNYLASAFWKTIKIREESGTKGNDLIDIIINMRKDKELCEEIDFEGVKVVAQAVQFFAAGFETTSSTMAFMLYELCLHPDMQDKLRQEIMDSIKNNNGITYEGISEMKYLDMCVMETLRMYPVLPFIDRKCDADYKIPGTDVVLDKGTPVVIPMLGLHYDEKYFPKPDEFNPERFTNKKIF